MARPASFPMDRAVAAEINQRIEKAMSDMFVAIDDLRETLDEAAFKKLTGDLCNIVFDLDYYVLEPIYREHPDLRPPDMGPYPAPGVCRFRDVD